MFKILKLGNGSAKVMKNLATTVSIVVFCALFTQIAANSQDAGGYTESTNFENAPVLPEKREFLING